MPGMFRVRRACLVILIGALPVVACGESGPTAEEIAAAEAREAALAAEAEARAARLAALEADRLAALWTYHDSQLSSGRQITASIRSTNDVDTGGDAGRAVQLVFRDHSSWGRSSYLVLQAGDFACAPRCTVAVTVDDEVPAEMAARRPATDEAIAMFINDAGELWRLASRARRISVEFPVAAGGTRTAVFDVAGLDESKMPGWPTS